MVFAGEGALRLDMKMLMMAASWKRNNRFPVDLNSWSRIKYCEYTLCNRYNAAAVVGLHVSALGMSCCASGLVEKIIGSLTDPLWWLLRGINTEGKSATCVDQARYGFLS